MCCALLFLQKTVTCLLNYTPSYVRRPQYLLTFEKVSTINTASKRCWLVKLAASLTRGFNIEQYFSQNL
jgi:hypothetical protein